MKACIVYSITRQNDAEALSLKLQSCGCEVNLIIVSEEKFTKLSECLVNIDICLIVLDDENIQFIDHLCETSSDSGARTIIVSELPSDALPSAVQTYADDVVCFDPDIIFDIICDDSSWPSDSKGTSVNRNIKRIKCQ